MGVPRYRAALAVTVAAAVGVLIGSSIPGGSGASGDVITPALQDRTTLALEQQAGRARSLAQYEARFRAAGLDGWADALARNYRGQLARNADKARADVASAGAPAVTPAPPPSTPPAPTTSTPTTPTTPDPPPTATGFRVGVVSNSDTTPGHVTPLDGDKAGGPVTRLEYGIGESAAAVRRDVQGFVDAGVPVLVLAGFHGRIPSEAEARNLGTWAEALEPLYRSGGVAAIEFGNETGYRHQGTFERGGDYARRADVALTAIAGRVPLLVQVDDGNTGSGWIRAMRDAVPTIFQRAAGGTLHPYGPWPGNGRNKTRNTVEQLAAVGAGALPIHVTEWGLASDNGRTLTDNYGWPTNQTYQQAGVAFTGFLTSIRAELGGRLRSFYWYQVRDQRPSGDGDTGRERWFGAVQQNGAAKGALTVALRDAWLANP